MVAVPSSKCNPCTLWCDPGASVGSSSTHVVMLSGSSCLHDHTLSGAVIIANPSHLSAAITATMSPPCECSLARTATVAPTLSAGAVSSVRGDVGNNDLGCGSTHVGMIAPIHVAHTTGATKSCVGWSDLSTAVPHASIPLVVAPSAHVSLMLGTVAAYIRYTRCNSSPSVSSLMASLNSMSASVTKYTGLMTILTSGLTEFSMVASAGAAYPGEGPDSDLVVGSTSAAMVATTATS